jgi:hypothetical protein
MKDAKLTKHDILLFRAGCEESFLGRFHFVGECKAHESLRVEISYKP